MARSSLGSPLHWSCAIGVLLVGLGLGSCGAGDDPGGAPIDQLCRALAGAPDCDVAATCVDRFEQGKVMNPGCDALYDDFAVCMATLDLACVVGSDFAVYGTGDGTQDGAVVVSPAYLFYVQDTACRATAEELEDCTRCARATGYPDGRGVGDRCSAAEACADGLECSFGMCTKACTDDSDCLGTNIASDRCLNAFGLENLCIDGVCTSNSDVANDLCATYGDGWELGNFGQYCIHP